MHFNLKTSHRSEIEKKIGVEHKDLTDSRFSGIYNFLNYLSQRDNYWLVFIIVFALFAILSIAQFDAFTYIVLKKDSAIALVDQRTSNVATIISMTLAIIGLLLSNLAVKDNQTYKLLFVNSKLYLIIYYTLSVIFLLIIISTLRDTLSEPLYQRLVVSGTYLALLILVGIGYLFRTIINFTNAGKIQNTLSEQLLAEAKQNLRINLLSKYSQLEFQKFLAENGIEYNEVASFHNSQNSNKLSTKREMLIYNIDFKKLKGKLEKRMDKLQQHYYSNRIFVNLVSKDYNNFIWPLMKESSTDTIDFSECFTLKNTSALLGKSDEYKKYFDTKLQEYAAEGKHHKVAEILSIYADLYTLNNKYE